MDTKTALRELARLRSEQPEQELTSELFSYATDAANLLLARSGFPSEHRAFVDALIGASAGVTEWFEVSDYDLGKRMLGGTQARERSRGAITKRVQRSRGAVTEWQGESGYLIVECMPGGRDSEGHLHRSKYRLNLLTAAVASVEQAGTETFSERALKEATKEQLGTMQESATKVSKRERFNRPRTDPQAVAARNIATAHTLLEKAAQLMVLCGDSPAVKFRPIVELIERVSEAPPHVDKSVHTLSSVVSMDSPQDVEPQHLGPETAEPQDLGTQGEGLGSDDSELLDMGGLHPQGGTPCEIAASRDMALFASVGAVSFDVTTTEADKKVCEFAGSLPAPHALKVVTSILEGCREHSLNVIVRPRLEPRDGVELIPLDDLRGAPVEQAEPFGFRTIETSPGNYQVWLAVKGAPATFAAELKRQLGADVGANGATRLAGSLNVKPQYFPTLPTVRLVSARPGRITDRDELIKAGLFNPAIGAEKIAPPVGAASRRRPLCEPSSFPPWEASGNRSIEDYHWVHRAYELGWHFWPDKLAAQLMAVSPKAAARGIAYARLIVKNALRKHGVDVEFE